MDRSYITEYLDQAVELELNMSRLYMLLAQTYEEDYSLWWTLSNEEVNHASLLRSGIEFAKVDKFPYELVLNNINDIRRLNEKFDSIIESVTDGKSREAAFTTALELESSAEESHFQEVMAGHSDNEIIKIFKRLNEDDINHYDRIKEYYDEYVKEKEG